MKTREFTLSILCAITLFNCHPSEEPFFEELTNEGPVPTISFDRLEATLSAGENSNAIISDTITVSSNVTWKFINGSPSQFKVSRIDRANATSLLAISTSINRELLLKEGKIIVYGDSLPVQEITLRQRPATFVQKISGSDQQSYLDADLASSKFGYITAMSFNSSQNAIFLADNLNGKVRKIDLTNQKVSSLPGTYGNLFGLCSDVFGDVYLGGSSRGFMKISSNGEISELQWQIGDIGLLATQSNSNSPIYYALGNELFKVDREANRETLFAGSSVAGFLDGVADQARFDFPVGLAVAPDGGLYVSDDHNVRIRRISPEGIVTTVLGGTRGLADGLLSSAQLWAPRGLTVSGSGTIYFLDGSEVRKITADNVVTTLELINDAPEQGAYTAISCSGNTIYLSTATSIYQFSEE